MRVTALLVAGASAANYYDNECATWQHGGFGARAKQVFGVRSSEECAKYAIDNGYAGFDTAWKAAPGRSWESQTYSNAACKSHCDFEIYSSHHCWMRDAATPCVHYCADGYGPSWASYTVSSGTNCPLTDGKYDAAGDSSVVVRDCEGHWETCNRNCEETFKITKSESGGGAACEAENNEKRSCNPGEGQCPVHCVGDFEPCNADCKKVFKYSTAPSNGGNQCKHPGEGTNVNVYEGDTLMCSPGEGDCPAGPYRKARYHDSPCATWVYGGFGTRGPKVEGVKSVEECAKYALDNGYAGFTTAWTVKPGNQMEQFIRYNNAECGEHCEWKIYSQNHCWMRETSESDCIHYCADGYGPSWATYNVTPGTQCDLDSNGEYVIPNVDCEEEDWTVGTCDKECRGGKRTNTRGVLKQPSGSGRACGAMTQEEDCNPQRCIPMGSLQAFKDWCNDGGKDRCKLCKGKWMKAKKAKLRRDGTVKRAARVEGCKIQAKKLKCKKFKNMSVCDKVGCSEKNGRCAGKSSLV